MSKFIMRWKNGVERMKVQKKEKRDRNAEGDYYYRNCDTL